MGAEVIPIKDPPNEYHQGYRDGYRDGAREAQLQIIKRLDELENDYIDLIGKLKRLQARLPKFKRRTKK